MLNITPNLELVSKPQQAGTLPPTDVNTTPLVPAHPSPSHQPIQPDVQRVSPTEPGEKQAGEKQDYNNLVVNHPAWGRVRGGLSTANRLWPPVGAGTSGASNMDYCALSVREGTVRAVAGERSLALLCLNLKVALDLRLAKK